MKNTILILIVSALIMSCSSTTPSEVVVNVDSTSVVDTNGCALPCPVETDTNATNK